MESLVTGKFHQVKSDFDPNKDTSQNQVIDQDGDGIISTQELNDYEMKLQQGIWVNRINKAYNMILGLLGGMSVMHIIFISAQSKDDEFYKTYSLNGNLVCIIMQVLANLALVLGFSLSFIYRNISQEKMRNLDADRLQFNHHYVLGLVTQSLVFVSWVLLHLIPKYTNMFFYLDYNKIKSADFLAFKIMSYVADVFLILSWIVASAYNKAAIENVYLDPEDMKKQARQQAGGDVSDEDDCGPARQ